MKRRNPHLHSQEKESAWLVNFSFNETIDSSMRLDEPVPKRTKALKKIKHLEQQRVSKILSMKKISAMQNKPQDYSNEHAHIKLQRSGMPYETANARSP